MRNALAVGSALAMLSGCATDCNHPASRCYVQRVEAKHAAERASEQALRAQCTPAAPKSIDWKEWTSASKLGDGSSFTFRGSRIGDPIEQLFPCHERTDIAGKANHCGADRDVPGLKVCIDLSRISPSGLIGPPSIGDITTETVMYNYLDGKLVGFAVTIHNDRSTDLSRLLEAKYGKPTSREVGSVQNRMGATFDRFTESWATPDGKMVFQSRCGSIDNACLLFVNPEAERIKEERRKAAAKDKAKGAL